MANVILEKFRNDNKVVRNTNCRFIPEHILCYYLSMNAFLTRREAECFYLLSKVPTVKKIANILSLSPRTIEEYINNVKVKMGVYSKADLIVRAIEFATEIKN